MEEDGFLKQKTGFATVAIHAGQEPERWNSGAVVTPIVTSATFKQTLSSEREGYLYGRAGNPTRNALEECLAALDGGRHALTFGSGLGAVTTVTALLSRGDHIVCTVQVFCGTLVLLSRVVSRLGIDISFTDFTDLDKVNNAIQDNTKMIWIETPTNPMMQVIDIAAIVKVAKSRSDIIVVVDNTFLTPYFQRPLDFGADIVVYSLTKYMNGHSDVIMGAAVVKDDGIGAKLRFLQNAMGAIPSPMDCYLVIRSLKTLPVRMEQHKKSSLIIANWLLKHPNVTNVYHPGLPSHPQYVISKRQTSGYSGIFSFAHSGGLEESNKILSSFKIITFAASLGGYESLAELPSKISYKSLPAEERAKLGITDSVIRLSVGLEDTEDIIEDLKQAFDEVFELNNGSEYCKELFRVN